MTCVGSQCNSQQINLYVIYSTRHSHRGYHLISPQNKGDRINLSIYKQRMYQETASLHAQFMFHIVVNFINAVSLKHL